MSINENVLPDVMKSSLGTGGTSVGLATPESSISEFFGES
jgi:hypothetical protein